MVGCLADARRRKKNGGGGTIAGPARYGRIGRRLKISKSGKRAPKVNNLRGFFCPQAAPVATGRRAENREFRII
ncbi:hypothetical protein O9Z70_09280 [Devosia sp. YIM 151766]|uniref:hypothetical protein n=1 Tax=Devosia sp. YIM 151766 TaxID=3017325 RepID=UPI00255CCB9B|nr:hypothetical protein [Devosia sp. YIM 151766]WIY51682.1 hypothetical protein O9Z70_09280 [Devosia sp. YIM 151766]